jgi:hypothetical protein
MTLDDALQSPAVDLLLRLEDGGFDIRVSGERLQVKPSASLGPDQRTAIARHREALIVLVGYCQTLSSHDREAGLPFHFWRTWFRKEHFRAS